MTTHNYAGRDAMDELLDMDGQAARSELDLPNSLADLRL